jgi:hypothetical protein
MTMAEDLKDLIAKNLPSQVGDALKKRLAEADFFEKELKEYKESLAEARSRIIVLEKESAKCLQVIAREGALTANEIDFAKREAVLKAREELINSMLDRNEKVVLAVFGNNRFKYVESDAHTVNVPVPPGGNWPQHTTITNTNTRLVDGET